MSNNKTPLLSVLMPTYNCAYYVAAAIASIQAQTFSDFEFIIIDDGSTDQTLAEVERLAALDKRIHLYQKENTGLVDTLNIGIGLCRGQFIARMDADDIALPERFQCEVAALTADPKLGVVGSWAKLFGTRREIWHHRAEDNFIKNLLLFKTSGFQHSSVMMRADIFKDFCYSSAYPHIEDAALWCDIAAHSEWSFANIRQVLIKYRTHNKQISQRFHEIQNSNFAKLTCAYARALGAPETITRQVDNVKTILHDKKIRNVDDFEWLYNWLVELRQSINLNDDFFVFDEQLRKCGKWYDPKKYPPLAINNRFCFL